MRISAPRQATTTTWNTIIKNDESLTKIQRRSSMRKFVFIAQLIVGAISLMAFASAPLTFAVAHEGEEHETIAGEVQKIDETAGKITLKHGPIKSLGMD